MNDIQRWLYSSATGDLRSLAAGADLVTLANALGLAALFGFVHAWMPGHGKVALVSYYLGRPARLLDSAATSAILIFVHVGSAVVLVLAGFTAIRATLGGVGRAPAFELASAVLVMAVGVWLLVAALRRHDAHPPGRGPLVALATGLVPCPLTTFIMVYSAANGIVGAGLLIAIAMAAGMVVTIFLFAGSTILLRERALHFFERTAAARER